VTLPIARDDESESEPAWLKRFTPPDALRVMAATSSSSDAAAGDDDAEGEAEREGERRSEGKDQIERSANEKKATVEVKGAAAVKGAEAPKPVESSSTRVDLVASAHLGGKSKVLFEIEGAGEAVDLDGDTGAVGRWLAEGSRSLKVDMKGVMYHARVLPLASSVVVVAVNADVAKIESVHREFVQLREDPSSLGGMENYGVGSLFDAPENAPSDDDVAPEPTVSKKRARAADAKASAPKRARKTTGARAKPKPKPKQTKSRATKSRVV